ncbi:MAG: A/G-specific adenine glycosylase [Rhodospirillales bacterium]|jgi:A/G-specific adenine glycosylase|nr:A/G-specific adenine glycosylase [Rhodospirillales bacterium]
MSASAITDPARLASRLLDWYDANKRDLPWRAIAGERADPYAVWVSEVMLQQTTVAAVRPYYEAFLARWPTVEALAAASLDEVLQTWRGLGYYARARNLHACARLIAGERGGRWPQAEADLRALPGIGAYTAAAIAAIAFEHGSTPVDGNVLRIIARVFGIETPLPAAKAELTRLARTLTPPRRTGDFAQATMELGATVCRPRRPGCDRCPWADDCVARAKGSAERLPRRSARPPRPTRQGWAFWLEHADAGVLLRQRPARGLLGGMMEVPSTPWRRAPWTAAEAIAIAAPADARWRPLNAVVEHTFTHFHLRLSVLAARLEGPPPPDVAGTWVPLPDLEDQALPSLMMKVVAAARGEA